MALAADTADAGGALRAAIGNAALTVSLTSNPDYWLTIEAQDADASQLDLQDTTATWASAWDNTDLAFLVGGYRALKQLTLSAPGHPLEFGFQLTAPDGHTITIVGNGFTVADGMSVTIELSTDEKEDGT